MVNHLGLIRAHSLANKAFKEIRELQVRPDRKVRKVLPQRWHRGESNSFAWLLLRRRTQCIGERAQAKD
jgi:hypothetical protein